MPNILFFDTETTGKYDFKLPPDHPSQPHLVQLACILEDSEGAERALVDIIIKPEGYNISEEVAKIHGISDDIANRFGVNRKTAGFLFNNLCYQADLLVAHNVNFDKAIMQTLYSRLDHANRLSKINKFCTMQTATSIVKVPRPGGSIRPNDWKWPTLTECMEFFFQEDHEGAHNALADVRACRRVYHELLKHLSERGS